MKFAFFKLATASVLAGLLIIAVPGHGIAGSLAGSVGDKRFSPVVPASAKDPCNKAYKAYVAASGHSAYATTSFVRVMDGYVLCGAHYNAPSQKAAEDLAMKSCQSARTHYKVAAGGDCQ
ncbi:hypothetical protein RFM68_08950 [Mesorhizobium sp. MSK_1335]|uniref:DUF4189 domain-containing protein n=1 Tax=Mesorhizobium montanum TaxID=3072323 RepID=A0ABU4ZJV6_9HYPH|nr:hypothetical protein [Mesorhizobium sp. MSK_1335]MDX8524634.1 hypothetical protein [Mesorhizobium sp. MSK_1335]